jgi:hypothetical protein
MDVTREDAIGIVRAGLGPVLVEHGFKPSRNYLTFKRKLAEAEQRIRVVLAFNPPYARGQIHFLPDFTLRLPEVGRVLERIAVGPKYYGGAPDDHAIWEQVANISGARAKGHWYLTSPREADDLARQQAAFFREWVIPFADEYQGARGLVDGYLKDDPRLALGLWRVPMVAAAMVVLGRQREARELIASKHDVVKESGYSWDGVLNALSSE